MNRNQFTGSDQNPARGPGAAGTHATGSFGGPCVLSASSLSGDDVRNRKGESLGHIKDIMLDTERGEIRYAVLSFGGFLGLGDKLFAVPWQAMRLNPEDKCFILDVDEERLKAAPGFDKDNWPNMADPAWASGIESHYGTHRSTPRI